MCILWHKWTDWSNEYHVRTGIVDGIHQYEDRQARTCLKCNNKQERAILRVYGRPKRKDLDQNVQDDQELRPWKRWKSR